MVEAAFDDRSEKFDVVNMIRSPSCECHEPSTTASEACHAHQTPLPSRATQASLPHPGIYFPICALITEPSNVGQSRFQLNDGSVTAP